MLCCLDSWSDPKSAYHRQTSDGFGGYPGDRRYQKTGGNALRGAPPASQTPNASGAGDMVSGKNEHFQEDMLLHTHRQSHSLSLSLILSLVQVTVPPGVQGGQTIHVNGPDGRTVQATVPHGMGPGSTFMVSMPPRAVSPVPSVATATTNAVANPSHYSNVQAVPPPPQVTRTVHNEPFAQAYPVGGSSSPDAATVHASPVPMAAPVAAAAAPVSPQLAAVAPMPAPPRKLMTVQVPPGVAPGSTIHVQVPGENRTVAAQVPHGGVTQFNVAYDAATPAASSSPPPPTARPGEKLLLVRVPPGTAPGTMLHVNVPDEPGRVIAATVPPGNVSEFHVSYIPGNQPTTTTTVQGTTPYHNNRQQYGNNNNNNGYNNGYNNNNNGYNNRHNNGYNQRGQSGGGGMGSMLLPLLGGAALGAAGMSMYDHYGHNGGDYGGGGGDYGGGGDDYGGGDYGGEAVDNGGGYEDYGGGGDDFGGGGGDDFGGGFGDY